MLRRLMVRSAARLPGVRRLPMFKLIALAEIALLARSHIGRLDAPERRRFLDLLRKSRGRAGQLAPGERDELQTLVAKMEPRRFAGIAADKLSPVPLPKRVAHGPRRDRRAA